MKNYIKITLMTLSLVAFTACDLEEELISDLTKPYVAAAGGGGGAQYSSGATDGSAQRASDNLGGAFGTLRSSGSGGHGSYWSMQSVSTDEMLVGVKGGDWYDGGIWVVTHRHTVSSAHGPNSGMWSGQYNAINEINNVLAGSITANETAQLRVLRALFYMRLADLYGGVKIVTAAGQDPAQSTRKQVFEFAESEILAALGTTAAAVLSGSIDLSGSDLNTNPQKYRINQYAAMGILSRLYLNAKVWTSANTAGTDGTARWTEAANAADWVITNGPYVLVDDSYSVANLAARPDSSGLNDPATLSGVLTIGAPNNQDNPEIIFSIDYDQATGKGGMPFAQMSLHQPSQNTFNLASQPWNGYQTMEDMYKKYEAGDKRLGWFLTGSQKSSAGKQLVDWAYDDKADDAVAASGWPASDFGKPDLVYTPYVNELEPDSWRQTGARMYKFSYKQFQQNDMDNDMPIIRLAEMYFNRAEGRSMAAGDWSLGLADVNAVRSRAGVANLATLDAAKFADESGKEFIFESHRRTNLVRWGKFTEAWWEKTGAKGGSVGDDNKNLFPIPLSQIQAANGSLTQNPGY